MGTKSSQLRSDFNEHQLSTYPVTPGNFAKGKSLDGFVNEAQTIRECKYLFAEILRLSRKDKELLECLEDFYERRAGFVADVPDKSQKSIGGTILVP